MGFNYIMTQDVKHVIANGQGSIVTSNGEKGSIILKGNKGEVKLPNMN